MHRRRVILATWYPNDPERPHGGVEAVSVVLARALAARPELDVHVVTVTPSVDAPTSAAEEDLTIHRLPRGKQPLLAYATGEGRRLVDATLQSLRPDVVHAHDTFGIMTRHSSGPRVFTIHGFIHEDTRFRGGMKAQVRAWLWKRAEVGTWADQPNIIAISPYVRERLRGIARGSIYDIENPIAPDCFTVARDNVKPHIFSAAVINARKNTLGLIEAFAQARLPGWRLRLAGAITDEKYGQAVKASIARHGLESAVDLLGAVPRTQIRSELAQASIFALVSLEEGAPMGVAEAMAAAVPVVTSNRCGMPYMLRDGESGLLVDPTRPASVASVLRALAENPTWRTGVGEEARRRAEACFHPDRVAARTARVYARLCGEAAA